MSLNSERHHRYYSETEKDLLVSKLLESGLSINRFSKEFGLIPNTLSNWVKKRGIVYYCCPVKV